MLELILTCIATIVVIAIESNKRNRQRPEAPQPIQKTQEEMYREAMFKGLR